MLSKVGVSYSLFCCNFWLLYQVSVFLFFFFFSSCFTLYLEVLERRGAGKRGSAPAPLIRTTSEHSAVHWRRIDRNQFNIHCSRWKLQRVCTPSPHSSFTSWLMCTLILFFSRALKNFYSEMWSFQWIRS